MPRHPSPNGRHFLVAKDVLHSKGKVITPALAHASALRLTQGGSVEASADKPVGGPVDKFMIDHIGGKGGMTIGVGDQAHIHSGIHTVVRRQQVGRPGDGAAVGMGFDRIPTRTEAREVDLLEIPSAFVKPEQVEKSCI